MTDIWEIFLTLLKTRQKIQVNTVQNQFEQSTYRLRFCNGLNGVIVSWTMSYENWASLRKFLWLRFPFSFWPLKIFSRPYNLLHCLMRARLPPAALNGFKLSCTLLIVSCNILWVLMLFVFISSICFWNFTNEEWLAAHLFILFETGAAYLWYIASICDSRGRKKLFLLPHPPKLHYFSSYPLLFLWSILTISYSYLYD